MSNFLVYFEIYINHELSDYSHVILMNEFVLFASYCKGLLTILKKFQTINVFKMARTPGKNVQRSQMNKNTFIQQNSTVKITFF